MAAIPIIALFISILSLIIMIKRYKLEKIKTENEKKKTEQALHENKLQRIAYSAKKPSVNQFPISRKFLSKFPSIPDEFENQSLEYIFEKRGSDECVVFISGLGLDHRDFELHVQAFQNKDCLALTTYGFQQLGSGFIPLLLSDHINILVHAINQLLNDNHYKTIKFVGFSIGADLGLLIISNEKLVPKFFSIILLEPNIDHSTLFISKRLAKLSTGKTPLDIATEISSCLEYRNIENWIDVHIYLVKVFDKFGPNRLSFLQNFSSQIIGKYDRIGIDYFESLILDASKNVDKCIIMLADNIDKNKRDELENQLTKRLPPNVKIIIKDDTSHFDFIKNIGIIENVLKNA